MIIIALAASVALLNMIPPHRPAWQVVAMIGADIVAFVAIAFLLDAWGHL